MKIAAAQTVPHDGDIQANIDAHMRLAALAAAAGARLIIFPEMSLTGYQREQARDLAFEAEDKRLLPLRELSRKSNIVIVAGAPINMDEQLLIGAFITMPNGEEKLYTKQYLHEGEELFFRPSFAYNPILDMEGERIAFAICADIAHAEHAKEAAQSGATLYAAGIFYTPAGLAKGYADLASHAWDFSMNVLMANYGGLSCGMASGGGSAFWSAGGTSIAQLTATGEGLLIVEKRFVAGSGTLYFSNMIA